MKELKRAEALLRRGDYTCVICDKDRVLTSTKKGVAPLLERIHNGDDLRGVCVADHVIGRAAALLLLHGGVSAVYGEVLSQPAKELLEANGIAVEFGTLVPGIRNRADTGPCPMEQAVENITDPAQALPALEAKIAALRAGLAK